MTLITLRAWLNGNRDYNTGVAIYAINDPDENLLHVLKQGPNAFRAARLQEQLISIYNQLKSDADNNPGDFNRRGTGMPGTDDQGADPQQQDHKKTTAGPAGHGKKEQRPVNVALYDACKLEADNAYKKVMNTRAILFKMTDGEQWENPNQEHKINDRAPLAIEVVQGFQRVSALYDRAEYVKLHGRLPDVGDPEEVEASEYDHSPDALVKLHLDNARKALNKLKKKESSPERIQLMQQHEKNIKKLEIKWRSLQAGK